MTRVVGRRAESGGGVEMTSRMIGNALVVHPRDQLTAEARNLALDVAADPQYDLVVVDLPTGSPIAAWESVADLMPRPRRGVRIVIGGRSRETTALAGQWLAERLNRPVVAPDGVIVPGVGGSLFVDDGRRTGWIRFQPGKAPRWDSKRFPKPDWESEDLAEASATSAIGIAEPVSGGIWIRPTGDEGKVRAHRTRLHENLPCQADVLTLVLGCPDAPAISFDDVARFWTGLPKSVRVKTRLLRYGRLSDADGDSSAQALADFIGEDLVWYTGLPVGAVVDPDVYTIRPNGVLGWRSNARELGYSPGSGDGTALPRLVSHRPPVAGVSEVGPAVYWYAPDAVVEVVQAGLWVRPSEEPPHAQSVRATPLDPERHLMLFDATSEAVEARMRLLAEDLVARLDPTTRYLSDLVPVRGQAPVRAAGRGRAHAGLDQDVENHSDAQAAPDPQTSADPRTSPERAPDGEAVRQSGIGQRLGTADLGSAPEHLLVAAGPELPGSAFPGPAVAEPGNAAPPASPALPGPKPGVALSELSEDSGPTAAPVVPASPALPPTGFAPSAGPRLAPTAGDPAPVAPAPVTAPPPALGPAVVPSTSPPPGALPPVGAPPVSPPPAATLPVASPVPTATSAPVAPAGSTTATGTGVGNTEPGGTPETARPIRATGVQPVPAASAAAVVPKRGLEEERAWLRRTLNQQFASVANSVARVLSEHPSFQGSTGRSSDLLTDAVAVRLYLSPDGDGVDAALRSAQVGPHVPFARCAVSGLTRLPSHRGIAVITASLTEHELELYRGRKFLTEWGFLNALSAPCARHEGEVDVLLWSMTGRRTRMLEPDVGAVPDRVLFVPGTSFKVLGVTEPADGARGQVLLRELAAGEVDSNGRVDRNRVSLDELAVTALRTAADKWAKAERVARTPEGSAPRFQALPGLV
ncbi:hypothetical protein ACQPYE_17135 [Actinosynnema sp. CA-299493]